MIGPLAPVLRAIKFAEKYVKFADDQGKVAETEQGLQNIMNRVNDVSKEYGMKNNVEKTKLIEFTNNFFSFLNSTVQCHNARHSTCGGLFHAKIDMSQYGLNSSRHLGAKVQTELPIARRNYL